MELSKNIKNNVKREKKNKNSENKELMGQIH
jgi:hypothetical protein